MQLRPYQVKAIDDLHEGFVEGHLRQVLMMATGSGKTATASEIIRRTAERGKRSIFVVERKVLVVQAARHLAQIGLDVGIWQGDSTDFRGHEQAVVASIQTIHSRGLPFDPGLFVVDECHILHKAHVELLEGRNAVPAIGLSATPLREGLGTLFSRLVKGPTIADLIADGHLIQTKAFGPANNRVDEALVGVQTRRGDFVVEQLGKAMNSKELVGDLIETWKAKADGRPTLVFAVDIAHSCSIVDDFNAEGIKAAHIDAYTDEEDRQSIFEDFRAGRITVLSSVNVLGVGFDMPIAEVAILARPTQSLMLHIQQLGRVMRPSPGKTHALILDHAGNYARHGRPEEFTIDSLDDGEIKEKRTNRDPTEMVVCKGCGFLMDRTETECPECGLERRRKNTVVVRDGDLVEIGGAEAIRQQLDRRAFYQELAAIQVARGRKRGWTAHTYKERFGEWPPYGWNRLPTIEPSHATLRWIKSREIAYAKAMRRRSPEVAT